MHHISSGDDGHLSLYLLVISPEMTCKTGQMSVCSSMHPSMGCQHFQKPKAVRLLGWGGWNLARIFHGSMDTTSRKWNFEFWPLCRAGEMTYPDRDAYYSWLWHSTQITTIFTSGTLTSQQLDATCIKFCASWQKGGCCYNCDWQAGRDQPVVEQAAAVTSDAVDNRYTGKFNAAPQVI